MTTAILFCFALLGADSPVQDQAETFRLERIEQIGLTANVGRETSRARFSIDEGNVIVDITSDFGIDKATITRKSDQWPKSILVRLHLAGLESFKAGVKDTTVEWSVSSTGGHPTRMSLWKGRGEQAMPSNSPYRTKLRSVGGDGKIPLEDGYFEIPLPAKLFERNPTQVSLQWIDFYRN